MIEAKSGALNQGIVPVDHGSIMTIRGITGLS